MISSVIPARLEFSCGHAALVSLPRLKGETAAQRTERVSREKAEARGRACDFCGPREQALLEVRPVQEAVVSGGLNGHHAVGEAVGEKENGMHSAETPPSVTRLGDEETRRTFPPRRRLNEEQEREVTRLYTETTMSVPEISKQFQIGESSVYRIAQRHGAGLRGRTSASPSTPPAVTPQVQPPAPAAPVAAPVPARVPAVRRAASRPAAAAKPAPSPRRRTAPAASGAMHRFQVRFRAETVLQAADIGAALRQVESLGATDVLAIVRTDR